MTRAIHPVVKMYLKDAEVNSTRHREQLFKKINDILLMAGIPPDKINEKVKEVHKAKREEIINSMHVSINTKEDRVIDLVLRGRLQPSVPKNIYSKLHRTNAEQCFSDNLEGSPIYGALNIDSQVGGAPAYSPDLWLRLSPADIKHTTTFTARDSYNVTLPFLAEFEPSQGKESLRHEIYTWETVPDYFLNRFWDLQDVETTTYIEAQVWGGVQLENVESFHIASNIRELFLLRIDNLIRHDNVKYVKDRLIFFD